MTQTVRASQEKTKRRRRRASAKAQKERRKALSGPEVVKREDGLTPFNARGSRIYTKPGRGRRGYYAPVPAGAPSTTRQTEIVNTAVVAPPRELDAPIVGEDILSSAIVTHDPFLAYEGGFVSSLNSLIIGDIGGGKSSLGKLSYVWRPLILGTRRAVVFDKKPSSANEREGEYAPLTRLFGGKPITFSTDGTGVRLNLLDPVIAQGNQANQMRLLIVVCELARSAPLDDWEKEALRAAYRVAQVGAESADRVAVLADVVSALGRLDDDPRQAYTDLSPRARDRLHEAGIGVRFLLAGLLEEYAGIFDGETSEGVQLESKLTSFDISQLPEDGPAVPMVMAVANMWLLGSIRANPGRKTLLLVEEGWHAVMGPSADLLKSNTKLSRALGLSLVIMIHKIADIPPESPAMALLQEAQTIHVFGQSRQSDIDRCVREFQLDPASAGLIPTLRRGQHIMKRGREPELLVSQPRSHIERRITDTDHAIVEEREGQ